jgi:hypothetical protein
VDVEEIHRRRCYAEDAADLGEAENKNREGRLGDMAEMAFEKSGHLSLFPSLFCVVCGQLPRLLFPFKS